MSYKLNEATNTGVDISDTSTLVVAEVQPGIRNGLIITNDGDADVYLSFGINDAAINVGVFVKAQGGSLFVDGASLFNGTIYGICDLEDTDVGHLCVCEW